MLLYFVKSINGKNFVVLLRFRSIISVFCTS